MLSRSSLTRLLLLAVFVAGTVVGAVSQPIWKLAVIELSQARFGELTFRCDNAMREHLVAKQTVVYSPSADTVRAVKAAEIALLDCQDYDMFRKTLGRWGLTENELSEMSLRAVEERAGSLAEVVKIHEIRY
jgi:hypothetical protein